MIGILLSLIREEFCGHHSHSLKKTLLISFFTFQHHFLFSFFFSSFKQRVCIIKKLMALFNKLQFLKDLSENLHWENNIFLWFFFIYKNVKYEYNEFKNQCMKHKKNIICMFSYGFHVSCHSGCYSFQLLTRYCPEKTHEKLKESPFTAIIRTCWILYITGSPQITMYNVV